MDGQAYAIKVQGKDYKTDGIKSLFPNMPVWVSLYGLVQDGVAFSYAELRSRMNGGGTYTRIAEGKAKAGGAPPSKPAPEKEMQAVAATAIVAKNADDDDDDDDADDDDDDDDDIVE
eukprot:COSAG01_NODE_16246_length_1255_cov_1.520761_2_plen_117_part_00